MVAYRSFDDIMREHDEWVQREIIDKNAAIIEAKERADKLNQSSASDNTIVIFPDPYLDSAMNTSPY